MMKLLPILPTPYIPFIKPTFEKYLGTEVTPTEKLRHQFLERILITLAYRVIGA